MVDGIAVYAKLVLVKTRQHELRELLPVPEPLRLHGLELALEGVLWVGGEGRGEGRGERQERCWEGSERVRK